MTNPLEPNDLSHLSDEEFMALCPQGFHGTGDFEPLTNEAILALAEEHDICYICPDGGVFYPFIEGTDMRDSLLSFARAVLERWGNYPAIPDSLIQAPPPTDDDLIEIARELRKTAEYLQLGCGWNKALRAIESAANLIEGDLLRRLAPPPEPPTDAEILEFLLERFQMHSPKMNGQHSWRFMNDYLMGKAIGRSAKDAVIACMREQAKRNTELEGHEK